MATDVCIKVNSIPHSPIGLESTVTHFRSQNAQESGKKINSMDATTSTLCVQIFKGRCSECFMLQSFVGLLVQLYVTHDIITLLYNFYLIFFSCICITVCSHQFILIHLLSFLKNHHMLSGLKTKTSSDQSMIMCRDRFIKNTQSLELRTRSKKKTFSQAN